MIILHTNKNAYTSPLNHSHPSSQPVSQSVSQSARDTTNIIIIIVVNLLLWHGSLWGQSSVEGIHVEGREGMMRTAFEEAPLTISGGGREEEKRFLYISKSPGTYSTASLIVPF